MNSEWNEISTLEDLKKIDQQSKERTVIIFKHSTHCSTSALVLGRLQRYWDGSEIDFSDFYWLDLIRHRDLSNEITRKYQVDHQSPQLLIIRNGECTYTASHFGIDYQTIKNKMDEKEHISSRVS